MALEKHKDTVNTLCFIKDENILQSGSNDKIVALRDRGASGRTNGNLSAQMISHATDGAYASMFKEMTVFDRMAIPSGSSHTFYALSESGLLAHFDLRIRKEPAMQLQILDSSAHNLSLYDIARDPRNPYLILAAAHDAAAHIFDIRMWPGNYSRPSNNMVCFNDNINIYPNEQVISHATDGAYASMFKEMTVFDRMAIPSGSSHTFYALSESGLLAHFDLRIRKEPAMQLQILDSSAHSLSLYDIARDPRNPYLILAAAHDAADKYDPEVYEGHKYMNSLTGVSFLNPIGISNTSMRSEHIKHIEHMKRRRGIPDLWKREIGNITPRIFSHSVRSNEIMIKKLSIERILNRHESCINSLCFNTDGTILLSCCDDGKLILWNWNDGSLKRSFNASGERIFSAKFIPWNDDNIVIGDSDGQVKHFNMLEVRNVRVLGKDLGAVYKLAIAPESLNTFYACTADGVVARFDLRAEEPTNCFRVTNASSPSLVVQLNALAVDSVNPWLIAVGGCEGRSLVHIYDVRKWDCSPISIPKYYSQNKVGCEGRSPRYAFGITEQMKSSFSSNPEMLENNLQMQNVKVYNGRSNMGDIMKEAYFLGPGSEYVASGCDSGDVLIWRKSSGEIVRTLKGNDFEVGCIESHPLISVLAVAGVNGQVKIWAPIF